MPGSVRVGGAWKAVAGISVRVGGAWKTVTGGWTRVGGVWKKWFDGAPAYQLIAQQTLATDASQILFNTIPTTFEHLDIVITARSTHTLNNAALLMEINGLTSGYVGGVTYSSGSTRTSNSNTTASSLVYYLPYTSSSANYFAVANYRINNYKNTTWYKRPIGTFGSQDDNNNATTVGWHNGFGSNVNTNAVTSLRFFSSSGNLLAGTNIRIYGIRG